MKMQERKDAPLTKSIAHRRMSQITCSIKLRKAVFALKRQDFEEAREMYASPANSPRLLDIGDLPDLSRCWAKAAVQCF